MERMEVLLTEFVKVWKIWIKLDDEKETEEVNNYWYRRYDKAREKLEEVYEIDFDDRDILKELIRYSISKTKPIYWVIESWYKLTNRKMKSIHQNWLKAKSKVEADGLVFNDYYEEADNEVHRAKLDQDGYDVTNEYASDSV